jgi:GrpB-like predicted nucleotidyltransferase (UPF0157 family)
MAVRVEPFDPSWAARFARERTRLARVLGASVVAIEHIGSTAVPGLAAKPTVDVMAGVRGELDEVVDPLEAAGYEYVPEWEAELPERRYFRLGREVQLHVVVHGTPFWERQLRFRDILRAEPEVRAGYEALKRHLAATCDSRRSYTEGKSDFVWGVLGAPDAAARAAIARAAAPSRPLATPSPPAVSPS